MNNFTKKEIQAAKARHDEIIKLDINSDTEERIMDYMAGEIYMWNEMKLPFLEKGDEIKLYGKKTIVEGFTASWNEAFNEYEIILLTTGRGDPFRRSLDVIELPQGKRNLIFE